MGSLGSTGMSPTAASSSLQKDAACEQELDLNQKERTHSSQSRLLRFPCAEEGSPLRLCAASRVVSKAVHAWKRVALHTSRRWLVGSFGFQSLQIAVKVADVLVNLGSSQYTTLLRPTTTQNTYCLVCLDGKRNLLVGVVERSTKRSLAECV